MQKNLLGIQPMEMRLLELSVQQTALEELYKRTGRKVILSNASIMGRSTDHSEESMPPMMERGLQSEAASTPGSRIIPNSARSKAMTGSLSVPTLSQH